LKTFAVDWLGTGRSSRVPFNIRPGKEGSIEAAENFFIDSLEEWRKEQGIERMILFGHSLGGYLSACYAMKYPDRVEHLFLVSPAGVPAAPPKAAPGMSDDAQEFRRRRRFLYATVTFFWERSYTPQGLIRFAGPWGPKVVKTYTDRRFSHLEGEEAEIFRNYSYHFNARKGSAESGLHCVLDVGAWGRSPLTNRVQNIRSPTTWLYGSHDWMNPNAGREAAAKMNVPTSVKVIPRADHHLYIDNPVAFNKAVTEVIRDIQQQAAAAQLKH
jgi:cardiolipin-specific phospholipase